jgi:hypothetical protein
VRIETLVAVDHDALASHQIQQWTIGFDGWARDVVFRLPPMGEPQFEVLIRKLSAFLFATDYKHYCLKLPIQREAIRTKYPLDVQVQVTDLEGWFESMGFCAVGSNDPRRLDDAPLGVYLSGDRGLVAWVAPRRGLEARDADARMFALDSDLILGAVPRDDSVVIFGRERVAPVAVLPPLRAEMIFQLAATDSVSLAQSYERMSFGAGTSYARWDWAPIYLSWELLDTEYGSILNLTDQLLKGWSMHGTVEYYNFPVPPPTQYPFAGSLFDLLRSPQLLFNWNTQGFGRRVTGGSREVYAPARTGALPVIYRPEQPQRKGLFDFLVPGDTELLPATHRAEEQAYAYYATRNDPLLARAVQYASLYQIFRAFGVTSWNNPPRPQWNQSAALKKVAAMVLMALREADEEAIKRTAAALAKEIQDRAKVARKTPPSNLSDEKYLAQTLTTLKTLYTDFYAKAGDRGEDALATALGRARDLDRAGLARLVSLDDDAQRILTVLRRVQWVPLRLCDVTKLQEEFSRSRGPVASAWIHTPTVVYSRTLETSALTTGGHNLDSATVQVTRDASLKRGEIRTPRAGVVVCHPDDVVTVQRYAWRIARTERPEVLRLFLEQRIKEAKPAPSRPLAEMLAIADPERLARGMSEDNVLGPAPSPAVGGGGNGRTPPPPPPAGTLPPSLPPENEGLGTGSGPEFGRVLFLSQQDGRVRIRRGGDRNGNGNGKSSGPGAAEPAPEDHWNRHDLVFALLGELEASQGRIRREAEGEGEGRGGLDSEPLRIVFDDSFSEEEARRVMDSLALQRPRAQSERLVVHYEMPKEKALELSRRTVTEVNLDLESVAAAPVNPAPGAGAAGTRAFGQLRAETGEGPIIVAFEVFLAGVSANAAQVQESAGRSATRAQAARLRLSDLPPAIYMGLIQDLKAIREGSRGRFSIRAGFGDVFVTEFHHGGSVIGTMHTVRE